MHEVSRSGFAVRRVASVGFGATALLVALGWAAPASAHVTVTPSTTAAGAYAVLEFSVGHGCGDSSTTAITIAMPEEINSVSPTRDALWQVEKKMEVLDPPVADAHGNELVERVASVTYTTDTPLPDGYRDTFQLSVQIPDDVGATLNFPTIQTCEKGESAWIEVPEDGQDAEELELPAPSFVVTEAGETGGDGHDEAGSDEPDASEETEKSADGNGLTMAALGAGVLGTVLGGSALVRQRRRA